MIFCLVVVAAGEPKNGSEFEPSEVYLLIALGR